MWKHIKWTPLIRGRLLNVNPELEKVFFSSVETLYGVPKATYATVKRKSRLQTHD